MLRDCIRGIQPVAQAFHSPNARANRPDPDKVIGSKTHAYFQIIPGYPVKANASAPQLERSKRRVFTRPSFVIPDVAKFLFLRCFSFLLERIAGEKRY